MMLAANEVVRQKGIQQRGQDRRLARHADDGNGGPALCMPAGGSLRPPSHETIDERLHYVKQDGQTVFKFAVRKTEEISRRILERNHLSANDVALFVSHQANRRIIEAACCRTQDSLRAISAEGTPCIEIMGWHSSSGA